MLARMTRTYYWTTHWVGYCAAVKIALRAPAHRICIEKKTSKTPLLATLRRIIVRRPILYANFRCAILRLKTLLRSMLSDLTNNVHPFGLVPLLKVRSYSYGNKQVNNKTNTKLSCRAGNASCCASWIMLPDYILYEISHLKTLEIGEWPWAIYITSRASALHCFRGIIYLLNTHSVQHPETNRQWTHKNT